MYKIEIKTMSVDHINDIMVVENLSFSIPWSQDAFIEEITRNKFAVYLAALSEGRVVGYAGMWKVCGEGHITNIAVHPEFRRNGVGALLLDKLIEIAKAEAITSMTLEVRRSNLSAQKLYSKFGFVVEGFRKAYYADTGEDAIIMWKNDVSGNIEQGK